MKTCACLLISLFTCTVAGLSFAQEPPPPPAPDAVQALPGPQFGPPQQPPYRAPPSGYAQPPGNYPQYPPGPPPPPPPGAHAPGGPRVVAPSQPYPYPYPPPGPYPRPLIIVPAPPMNSYDWTAAIDCMFLERSSGGSYYLGSTAYNPASGQPAAVPLGNLFSDDVDFPLEAGVRLEISHKITDYITISATYWGLQQWSASNYLPGDPVGETVLAFSPYLQLSANPPSGIGGFDTSLGYTYASQVENVEVNVLFRLNSDSAYWKFDWLWGVRYFNLAEQFALTGIDGFTGAYREPQLFDDEQPHRRADRTLADTRLGAVRMGDGRQGGSDGQHLSTARHRHDQRPRQSAARFRHLQQWHGRGGSVRGLRRRAGPHDPESLAADRLPVLRRRRRRPRAAAAQCLGPRRQRGV